MRPSTTLLGIVLASMAIIVLPWATATGYDSLRHSISELAAQDAPHAWAMRLGFIALGLGVAADALGRLRAAPLVGVAFLVFAGGMVMAGIWSHRPIDPAAPFDARQDALHSVGATLAGFAFAAGALAQARAEVRLARRAACLGAFVAALGLPLAMLAWPMFGGLAQRAMFAICFAWLVVFLPAPRRG